MTTSWATVVVSWVSSGVRGHNDDHAINIIDVIFHLHMYPMPCVQDMPLPWRTDQDECALSLVGLVKLHYLRMIIFELNNFEKCISDRIDHVMTTCQNTRYLHYSLAPSLLTPTSATG